MSDKIRRTTALLAAVGIGAACGGGGGSGNNPATTIAPTATASGNAQTGPVAAALADPLRVVVREDGVPLPGENVVWSASSGTVGPSPSTTNANGIAIATWTLGNLAGATQATATLAGAVGSPVSFTATANPGPAATLTIQSGDNQQTMATAGFAPLSVIVADGFGNGRTGHIVDWSVISGTLTLSGAQSTSGAGGVAIIGATAGATVGGASVRALVQDVDTVTFTLTVEAIPAAATVNAPGFAFLSDRNDSRNPAVDTVAVNATVTWDGLQNGFHLVRSTGSPSFTDQAGPSDSFQATFGTAGIFAYDCSIHPQMTGRVVVLP